MSRVPIGPLFDQPADPPAPDVRQMAHKSGPETSREAAADALASGHVTRQARIVLKALQENPGTTAAELHERTGLPELQQTRRRLTELKIAGKVEPGPKRVCRIRRRNCITWMVVE